MTPSALHGVLSNKSDITWSNGRTTAFDADGDDDAVAETLGDDDDEGVGVGVGVLVCDGERVGTAGGSVGVEPAISNGTGDDDAVAGPPSLPSSALHGTLPPGNNDGALAGAGAGRMSTPTQHVAPDRAVTSTSKTTARTNIPRRQRRTPCRATVGQPAGDSEQPHVSAQTVQPEE